MQVEKRCCSYYHPLQTLPRKKNFLVTSWKNLFGKKVDTSSTCCNMLLHLATMTLCGVTIFDVDGKYVQQRFSTCNSTMFRLQVAAICCSYYFTVKQSEPSLETLDFAFRTAPVHQPCAFWFVFQHCLRRTPNVYCTNWGLLLYVEGPNRGFHGILTSCGNDLERYKVYSSFIT